MSADAGAIDRALIARLSGDAALQALMPGGVYFDIGAPGQTAMVVVSLYTDENFQQFHGMAAERPVYQIKAVELNTSRTTAIEAAARIHALLQWDDGPPTLTIDGYDLMALRKVERVGYTELDASNPDLRWQHQGGLYEVIVAETGAVVTRATQEDSYGSTTRQ